MKVTKSSFQNFHIFLEALENLHSEISIKSDAKYSPVEKKNNSTHLLPDDNLETNPKAKTKGKAQVYVKPVYP